MVGMESNPAGSVAGAATPAVAGALGSLSPSLASSLGLGTTAAVGELGGALGGTGAGLGAGLGTLGGAGLALSFPAMALTNILTGLIGELGGGEHPSKGEYQQSAALRQIEGSSRGLLSKMRAAGLSDDQIVDFAKKNNLNYMLVNMPSDPSLSHKVGDVAWSDANLISQNPEMFNYTGAWNPTIQGVYTPSQRAILDQIATNAAFGVPTSWAGFEGSLGGWNPSWDLYKDYGKEGNAAALANLSLQYPSGMPITDGNPLMQSALDKRTEQLADLGYDPQSTKMFATSGPNLDNLTAAYERIVGPIFGAANLYPSAQMISNQLYGPWTGMSGDPGKTPEGYSLMQALYSPEAYALTGVRQPSYGNW
jgi:hypothetical protein